MKEDAPLRARPPPAIIDELCVRMGNYGRRMVMLDEKGLDGGDWRDGCRVKQSYTNVHYGNMDIQIVTKT